MLLDLQLLHQLTELLAQGVHYRYPTKDNFLDQSIH